MDPEQVKKLREEYERALDAAEARRADYHEAVLELHRGGMALREIAKELGLSHQRVHQIVTGEAPRRRNLGRAAGGIAGLMFLVAVIGVVAWTRSYQPLAFARADVLTAASFNTVGDNDYAAWVGYHKGIGGGAGRPFFGVTIQNTGSFTVRVLGYTPPPLPQFWPWSSRLLMAQGAFVQEPELTPSRLPLRDENGRIVRRRVWKRGPLQPFHPVDLAPGQIVMLLLQGVWDTCQVKPAGTTVPPQDFAVRYGFLWKTSTIRIPLPSGLTVIPAHSPRTGCRSGGNPRA